MNQQQIERALEGLQDRINKVADNYKKECENRWTNYHSTKRRKDARD